MKKSICFISDTFYPVSAGVGNATLSLAQAFARSGWQSSVITPRLSPSHPAFEVLDGIEIHRIGGKQLARFGPIVFLFYFHFFVCGLLKILFKIKPGVVLGQTPWEGGVLSAAVGMINPSIISITHTHGKPFTANRYMLLARLAYKFNKRVLATNADYAAEIRAMCPSVSPLIAGNIFYPPELDKSRVQLRAGFGFDDSRIHFISVGRLVYEKGVESKGFSYLVKAVAGIEGAVLHIFGDGPNRAMYENMANESGAGDRIVFHGEVARKTLLEYMKAGDALVISSINEGLSMMMIEAMSLGLAVISSDTSGAKEVISDGTSGLLFKAGDTYSLLACIKKFMADKDLRNKLSEGGISVWRSRFTSEAVLPQYMAAIGAGRQ